MIRLTWLQFRAQAVTAAAELAAFAVLLAATGPHMASLYAASGLSGCQGSSCQNLAGSFEAQLDGMRASRLVDLLAVLGQDLLVGGDHVLTGLYRPQDVLASRLDTADQLDDQVAAREDVVELAARACQDA